MLIFQFCPKSREMTSTGQLLQAVKFLAITEYCSGHLPTETH